MGYVPQRRWRLVPWTWFIALLVLYSIPGAKQQRYILVLVPAAALLIARVWLDHETFRGKSGAARGPRWLVWVHWGTLIAASIGFGLMLERPDRVATAFEYARVWLVDHGFREGWLGGQRTPDDWPTDAPIAALGGGAALLTALVLTALATVGLFWHRRWHTFRAGVVTGIWTLVALAVTWSAYAGAASAVHPLRADTEALRARIGQAPLRSLRLRTADGGPDYLNEEFRFFYGRLIRHIRPDGLAVYAAASGAAYVLARDATPSAAIMRDAGFVDEGRVRTDTDKYRRLWSRGPR